MALLISSCCISALLLILTTLKSVLESSYGAKLIESLTAITAALLASSFFYLVHSYVVSDLSNLNVALNSHSASQLLYKISGVWGNHEGSMLLWLVLLTTISTIFALQKSVEKRIRLKTLQILGTISMSFQLYILTTSNPFVQLHQIPKQGMGLNPILEDPALAIHPPILYTGLALLSVLFSYSCAVARLNQADATWVKNMRAWSLICWCFLTLGIALGSWWAYYELGWGGWWFWDPVENLSLLPWLTVTALIHSLITTDKQSQQYLFSFSLGISGFLFALCTLFLVRSGILSSVHAFAVNPVSGSILGLIFISYTLYGFFRAFLFQTKEGKQTVFFLSQESFLFLNVCLFIVMTCIVLTGTTYPILLNFSIGQIISVGAPYFNATVLPFFALTMLLMIFVPYLTYGEKLKDDYRFGITIILASIVVVLYIKTTWPLLACLFLALSITILITIAWDILKKILNKQKITLKLISMNLAHASIALIVLGAVIDSFDRYEKTDILRVGKPYSFKGYDLTLTAINQLNAPYFQRQVAQIQLSKDHFSSMLKPEKRYYPLHEMVTSETSIQAIGLADLYTVLGGSDGSDGWILKLHWHPTIRLIWLGAVLLVVSGLFGFVSALRKLRLK